MKLDSLSVFFPCFNEEENVELLVEDVSKYLPRFAKKYEVIFVNDGSQDQTLKAVKEAAKKNKFVRVVSHKKNKGYGEALKTGFANCIYEWVFFTDGDRQFRICELKKFIAQTKNYQAVLGYRKNRADGFLRWMNAKLFKGFVDVLFGLHVKDVDCAFKLIKKSELDQIQLKSEGAMISAELLFKLKNNGVVLKELAVRHYPRKHGNQTGNSIRVIVKAFKEAFKLSREMKA